MEYIAAEWVHWGLHQNRWGLRKILLDETDVKRRQIKQNTSRYFLKICIFTMTYSGFLWSKKPRGCFCFLTINTFCYGKKNLLRRDFIKSAGLCLLGHLLPEGMLAELPLLQWIQFLRWKSRKSMLSVIINSGRIFSRCGWRLIR